MSTAAIDDEARLAEMRSELRNAVRREQDVLDRLGRAVVAGMDPAEQHAELRRVREEVEGLVAASWIVDLDYPGGAG